MNVDADVTGLNIIIVIFFIFYFVVVKITFS